MDDLPRQAHFGALVARAQACQRCPRMVGRTRVLSAQNGPLDARVLFVAEAPGRLGGDRTGVPLSADQSGRNFGEFLSGAGLDRADVFVTNAVLCNPRDARGLNARPSVGELRNCSTHLADLLAILDPPWVVTLGRVALDALGRIAPHNVVLARDVATPIPWHGRTLVPLYHPSPNSVAHRGRAQHHADYARLVALLDGGAEMLAGVRWTAHARIRLVRHAEAALDQLKRLLMQHPGKDV